MVGALTFALVFRQLCENHYTDNANFKSNVHQDIFPFPQGVVRALYLLPLHSFQVGFNILVSHRAFIICQKWVVGSARPHLGRVRPTNLRELRMTRLFILEESVWPETACSVAEMTRYLTALVGTLKVMHSVLKE